jgi:hypothetical protein
MWSGQQPLILDADEFGVRYTPFFVRSATAERPLCLHPTEAAPLAYCEGALAENARHLLSRVPVPRDLLGPHRLQQLVEHRPDLVELFMDPVELLAAPEFKVLGRLPARARSVGSVSFGRGSPSAVIVVVVPGWGGVGQSALGSLSGAWVVTDNYGTRRGVLVRVAFSLAA